MKRILCILLMLVLALPVLAEENPHAPFTVTAPESVTREDNEGSVTYVYGTSSTRTPSSTRRSPWRRATPG